MTTDVVPGAPTPPDGTPPAATPPAPTPPAPTPPAPTPPTEPPKLELDETPAVEGLEATPVTYDPTGNTGLDMALEFVGNLGFGPDHAAMQAAEAGDFAPLKEALGKLGDKAKGWQRFVKLGEEAYASQANSKKEADTKLRNAIAKEVGGVEVWDQVRAWASANASPEEKVEVNAAFAAGGIVAKTMAKALFERWSLVADKDPAQAKSATAGTNAGAVDVLDAKGYQKAVAELAKKYNGDLEGRGAKEYQALQQRRLAAMRTGK